MFQRLNHRGGHYALLLTISALLFLPNLGAPSLWDVDEGNNAEAAREMLESGNWIVPTFNFKLRDDKPALLYWLQLSAYRFFGVGEFGARFPSALASLIAVGITYELGRRMFGSSAGLLAGLILASTPGYCAAAHFANPDALLNACVVLTLFLFWASFSRGGRGWFVPAGISAGLAVLAKGPSGLVLPGAVIGLFLLTSGRWRMLLDRRLAWGFLAFLLVAVPWYAWVGAETKGEFLLGFLGKHNVDRFLNPMENHRGPFFYYPVVLILGLTPWSVFLGATVWYIGKEWKKGIAEKGKAEDQGPCSPSNSFPLSSLISSSIRSFCCWFLAPARKLAQSYNLLPLSIRFLTCWIAVYLIFFSVASTKLPNYILPIYSPVVLLVAHFLDDWRRGLVHLPGWALQLSLVCLLLVGAGTAGGFFLAGGAVHLSLLRGRSFPELDSWALLGIVPILGAGAAWWCNRRRQRLGVLVSVSAAAILFVVPIASRGTVALDSYKAPRSLVEALQAQRREREIRVGCFDYFQPSLVFYCRHEICCLESERQVVDFLRYPLPVYLFVPAPVWSQLERKVPGPHALLARHWDLYRNCEVVLVTNR